MIQPKISDPWYQNGTLYHVFVLSFSDSNGDGYGDLPGLTSKLGYLSSSDSTSLGVSAISLAPIFVSPMVAWGEDVADFTDVDPRLGSMEDLENLVVEAHRLGIRVILELVTGSTSELHPWFTESRADDESEKRDWYIWADPNEDGGPPDDRQNRYGESAWTMDERTGQYYRHSGLREQPDLNWRSAEVREAMAGVIRFWLDKGVDGIRAPRSVGLAAASQGETSLCEAVGNVSEEIYMDVPDMDRHYAGCAHALHSPHVLDLRRVGMGAGSLRDFLDTVTPDEESPEWPQYVLSDGRDGRLATAVGEDRARLMAMLQLTQRGLPCVYFGDELGLGNGVVPASKRRDTLDIRHPGRGLGRDATRTPIPWDTEINASFTTGTPWLPVGAYGQSVALQQRRPASFLNLYRHLIHLRAACPALGAGGFRLVELPDAGILAFIRETELQRVLVMLNFTGRRAVAGLRAPIGKWIAGTHLVDGDGEQAKAAVSLRPYEGRIYELISTTNSG